MSRLDDGTEERGTEERGLASLWPWATQAPSTQLSRHANPATDKGINTTKTLLSAQAVSCACGMKDWGKVLGQG